MALISEAGVNTTESPEIGPPPVSQFVDEDPVKIDLPSRAKKLELDEPSSLDPAMSINLEQRKKRKDSIGGSESRRASKGEPIQGVKEPTGALKVGAKRKMSVRDDDDIDISTKKTDESSGDFKFSRAVSEDKTRNKPLALPDRPGNKVMKEPSIAKGAPREKSTSTTAISARKVLAPKSVNNSPRKGSRMAIHSDVNAGKADPIKPKQLKERPQEIKPETSSIPEPTVEIVLGEPEPGTPAALNIFSPFESQPSTARAASRDTPPPPDLGPGSEGHRPSRRARAAVSYAEPSLRDKMRRPTKELVDAVAGDAKLHRNSLKLEDGAVAPYKAGVDTQGAGIKTEPEGDDSWKAMPEPSAITVENSPLGSKASIAESLPSTITTHRKRRESLLNQVEIDAPRSSSGNAIVALLASNRKARAQAMEKSLDNQNIPKETAKIEIYEFRGSSPLDDGAPVKPTKAEKAASSRFSRRHTTISRDAALIDDSETSEMEATRKTEGVVSRRRQSTIVPRSSSLASVEPTLQDNTEKSLKKATSTTSIGDPAAGGSRSDRIAARRRSMML